MNVAQMLERSAFYFPERPALGFKDRRWTYREQAAVLGMPDAVKGEAVKAFVVLREGQSVDGETLKALCKEKIASYKVPEVVEFLPALPKSSTGKILKKNLRGSR